MCHGKSCVRRELRKRAWSQSRINKFIKDNPNVMEVVDTPQGVMFLLQIDVPVQAQIPWNHAAASHAYGFADGPVVGPVAPMGPHDMAAGTQAINNGFVARPQGIQDTFMASNVNAPAQAQGTLSTPMGFNFVAPAQAQGYQDDFNASNINVATARTEGIQDDFMSSNINYAGTQAQGIPAGYMPANSNGAAAQAQGYQDDSPVIDDEMIAVMRAALMAANDADANAQAQGTQDDLTASNDDASAQAEGIQDDLTASNDDDAGAQAEGIEDDYDVPDFPWDPTQWDPTDFLNQPDEAMEDILATFDDTIDPSVDM